MISNGVFSLIHSPDPVYCLSCIRRDQNATYKQDLNPGFHYSICISDQRFRLKYITRKTKQEIYPFEISFFLSWLICLKSPAYANILLLMSMIVSHISSFTAVPFVFYYAYAYVASENQALLPSKAVADPRLERINYAAWF